MQELRETILGLIPATGLSPMAISLKTEIPWFVIRDEMNQMVEEKILRKNQRGRYTRFDNRPIARAA